MKLPFGKTKDSRSEDAPGSQGRWKTWSGCDLRSPRSALSVILPSGVLTRVSLDAPAEAGPSSKPKPGFWKLLDWKLMFALLFPVTLETLDYTGMSVAPVE